MPQHTIDQQNSDIKISKWFAMHYPSAPFSLISKLIRKKLIKLNAKPTKISNVLKCGDQLSFPNIEHKLQQDTVRKKAPDSLIQKVRKSIIYQDDHIIAINKDTGIACQPGTNVKYSIFDLLEDIAPGTKLYPLHRLDKETSGVLLFGKNKAVTSHVMELFQDRKIHKEYLAIVSGSAGKASGQIKDDIEVEGDAKSALTDFELLDKNQEYSLLKLTPKTGRKHQLRIHCARSLEMPILGDKLHGNSDCAISKKLCLHSHLIKFKLYDSQILIKAPPRHDMFKLLQEFNMKRALKILRTE